MKPWKPVILLTLFLAAGLLSSCTRDDAAGCFDSTGDILKEQRPAAPFRYLEVHDNINLFLTNDSSSWDITVEAGENLIPGVKTEIEDGHLVIWNDNDCNWVRDFRVPINVYVTFVRLDSIVFRAAGDLVFTNYWRNDSVQFDAWEGAGLVDLRLLTMKSHVYVHYGTMDVNVSGTSQVTFISSKGYGPVNTLGLLSKFTYLSTSSPNDCYVYASVELGAEINNIGNVYYNGDPPLVTQVLNSQGRLIRLP
jgi:hypothetical protein